jgi:predicted Zn-dependent protease
LLLTSFSASQIASEREQFQVLVVTGLTGMGLALASLWNLIVGASMKRALTGIAITLSLVGCGISQQQEVQMGVEYAQQINAQLPIIQDPELNRYINVLGDSIARLTSRKDLDWHFFIVDAQEVNAFAVPGGFVYINRGLIQRADQMDEIAGVLGHEIGHVVRRHTVKQMEKAQGANVGVTLACILTSICNSQVAGAAINIAGGAVFARFSRQDEAEADDEGFNNVVRAGISPVGMVTMFQKLLDERKSRPAGVEAWFLTHPLEEDRITAIQARINQLPQGTLARLGTDTRNFHTFKSRIQSLPPSPPPRQLQ